MILRGCEDIPLNKLRRIKKGELKMAFAAIFAVLAVAIPTYTINKK
jgi:hypothetical protein